MGLKRFLAFPCCFSLLFLAFCCLTWSGPLVDLRPEVSDELSPEVVARRETTAEIFRKLYLSIEMFKGKQVTTGPITLYRLEGNPELPERIFIVKSNPFRAIVRGVLDAVLPEDWEGSGRYWVIEKEEAIKKIARAFKAVKDKKKMAEIRETLNEDFAQYFVIVYCNEKYGEDKSGKKEEKRELKPIELGSKDQKGEAKEGKKSKKKGKTSEKATEE